MDKPWLRYQHDPNEKLKEKINNEVWTFEKGKKKEKKKKTLIIWL